MSNAILGPQGVAERYQTHRSQIMTLWVTRQDQNFVASSDLQLCDVELINASVELVGEPGIGNIGIVTDAITPHRNTMNLLHGINDAGIKSTVYGIPIENRILHKTHLNHGHLSVSIVGMTQGHQFRQDSQVGGNNLQLTIPTDNGLILHRHVTWPPTPIMMENVHLQQNLRVQCAFTGTWPISKKVARFTEDWADTAGGIKRNTDGTVRYFVNDDEGQSSSQECQVPANCIDSLKLTFKISPRTQL